MPKVSVIMGAYNCDSTELRKAIESILNQSFNDFEFVICDDGSNNDTLSVLKYYENKDSRIKVLVHEKNMGLSIALNNCIENSVSNYIARMDADDVSHLDRLEKQYEYMLSNPEVDILGSNINFFDERGIFAKSNLSHIVSKNDFLYNSPLCHPTIMIKKEVYIKNGCYSTNKKVLRCEDYDFFATAFSNGARIVNFEESLYDYCENINSFNKRRKYKYRINEFYVRKKAYKKLKMPFFKRCIYSVKPLIIGLLPSFIYKRIKMKKHRRK